MNKTRAAIFDMDGVICHTNPYHSEAFRTFFGKRGFIPAESEFAAHMYGKSNSYIFSHFLGRPVTGVELQALEEEKEGLFREIYKSHVAEVPGLVAWLDRLQAAGVRLGVATSAPRANLELILGALSIGDRFGSVLASENVARHKPDPEVYLKSAAQLGMDPEQCVVFEDSFSGVTAAIRAGMHVVGVLTSHTREELPPCDLYVKDYESLSPELLDF